MMHATAAESTCTSPAAGYARLPNALIDRGAINTLRPVALRILLLMLRLADERGACWPSQRAIASRIGATKRSVQGAIGQLRERGLLSIERRGTSGQATRYRLHADAPPEPAADAAPAAPPPAPTVAANGSAMGADGRTPLRTKAHAASSDGRTPLRTKAKAASSGGRTPLRTTHTQDSDPTLTHRGGTASQTLAAADVCVELARADVSAPDARSGDEPAQPLDRVGRLLALGIDESMACRLLATHVPSRIDCALDNAAFLAAHDRLGNAAGYVIAALRHNYGPLPERLDHQRQQARQRRQRVATIRRDSESRARAQRDHAQADRDAADAFGFVAQLDPIARARAVREALAGQPSSIRAALAGRDPLKSRNLAMLVRAHLQQAQAGGLSSPASPSAVRTPPATGP